MPLTSQLQSLRKSYGIRVIWRLIKDVAVPVGVALLSTWYTMKAKPSWTWADAFQVFSTTFLAAGFFAGYVQRSQKLVKDEDRHSDVISKQDAIADKLAESVRLIDGYATGADSFAVLVKAEVEDFGSRKALQRVQFEMVGEFPLRDVHFRIWNRDDPTVHRLIASDGSSFEERIILRAGDFLPNVTYKRELGVDIFDGKTNRIDLTWFARNGTWFQRFEIKAIDGRYEHATFVIREEKEIYVGASEGYERDNVGRPIFDLSPSPLDASHPLIVKAL